ncbi:MAG: DUF2809 domain-containing protein [Bryobacterales bacterium]|nr:DUF2809 domain-containing protein [Bryobacterales bacterium]
MNSRGFWGALLTAVICVGLLSRAVHTGLLIFDKYLGDALYAAMVYAILRLTGRLARVALWASVAMLAIELFQLTGVPAHLLRSNYPAVRICARLLGSTFSVLDLLAYAVGILCLAGVDHRLRIRNASAACTAPRARNSPAT